MSATSFDVTAAGHRLRCQRIGGTLAGAEPVLVFLHEGLGSIGQWRDFPATLCAATGRAGLVYERWGHGGSDAVVAPRPADFLEREATEALPDLLGACGVVRPILVGHSDGGSIALLYAAAFPERPLACVSIAGHVFVEPETQAGLRGVLAAWEHGDLRRGLERHHGANAEPMLHAWLAHWMRPEAAGWSMLDRLPAIRCPTLAIQGAADEHGSPAQVEAIVGGVSGPAEAFMIPGCGHVPHLQAGAAVVERIARFLAALPPSSPSPLAGEGRGGG